MTGSKSVLSGKGVASIAKNACYLLGTLGLNHVVRFLYVIALAHYLGPELYGLLNYGMSWYLSFLPLTAFGMAFILSREIGRDRNCGAKVVSQTMTIRISLTVIAAMACSICGWFVEGKPEVRSLLMVFSIGLIGRSLAIWTHNVFTAYEATQYTFRLQSIFRLFEIVIGVLFLMVGYGAMAVAMIHAISWWLQALSGLGLVRRHFVATQLNWSWDDLKHILLQGLPLGLGVLMINWFQRAPVVLYRHMNGSENSLGQLALAMQAFLILCSIPMAAGEASLPVLSRAAERKDGKDFLFTETTMRAGFIFGGVVGLAGLGAGPFLIDVIFGSSYRETGYLLGFTMWLIIPWTCGSAISRMYVANGQFFLPTLCIGAGALVMTLILPKLVSVMDTAGAALATGIGLGIWMLSLIWILARAGDLDLHQTIFRPLAVILSAIGVFFVLKSINVCFALIASWGFVLSGTLLFGIITRDERDLLTSLRRRWYSSFGVKKNNP